MFKPHPMRLFALTIAAMLALAVSQGIAQSPPPPAEDPAADSAELCTPESCPPASDDTPAWLKTIEDAKNPTDWLSLGADLRLREVWFKNAITLSDKAPGNEYHFQRYRSRLWASAKPFEDIDLSLNARLTWEFRNYCKPESGDLRSVEWDEAVFDNLNIRWEKMLDTPLTVTVGRQDIIFGNGWLVLDGTPLDGSRTIFFDAARLTWDAQEELCTIFDLVYIDNGVQSDRWIEPFNDQERNLIEQHERGAIFYATNTSLKDTRIDGYFIYKHDDHVLANGNDSDIYTFGARVAGDVGENWKYRAEFAEQLGHQNGEDLCATGFNGRLEYHFNDKNKNFVYMAYEYLSGDDPDTAKIEEFDPLWGRWPQFSEAYVYTYITETRIADVTNLHRVGPGWGCEPTDKVSLNANYFLLFADQNTLGEQGVAGFTEAGSFRGQLVSAWMKYKFNEHVSGHLVGEFFCPGNYYDDSRNDPAVFLRYELVFSW
jgi:hypothetical protein